MATTSELSLSLKAGDAARDIPIDGGVVVHGKGIVPIEMLGSVGNLSISGGIKAAG